MRFFVPSRRSGRSRTIVAALALLATLLVPASAARAWEVRAEAPRQAFELFHDRFSAAAYHYPRHGAAPLGLIGFEAYADVAVDRDFDEEDFYPLAVSGDLPAGTLGIARVGARKGLPGNVDLGLAYGQAVDGDLDLVSADLQWAFVDGGAVTPALALRLTGTQTLDSGAYELEQYGAELMISKGFPLITPYAGAGLVYSEGTLKRGAGLDDFEVDDTRGVYFAGVVLNLLIPRITVEIERADVWQGAVRLGFGF